ncbi:hypothetical protein GN956_G10144 [Arapaima gigas]
MEAARGRRRLRETCPFRRLRKNRCYDIQNTSAVVAGEPWSHFNSRASLSAVHVGGDIAGVSTEPPARTAVCPSAPQVHLQEERYAMDTGSINPQCPQDRPSTHSPVLPAPLSSNLQSSPPHQALSILHCGTSMELDSDVDPETGEKAQS